MVAASLWMSSQIAELLSTSLAAKMAAVQTQLSSMIVVSTAWLIWVLLYTRNRRWVTRSLVVSMLLVDTLIVCLVMSNPHHRLIWDAFYFDVPTGILETGFGAGYWIVWAYLYSVFAVGIILLGKAFLRAGHIYRWEVTLLMLVSVIPWCVGLIDSLELLPGHSARGDVTAAAVSSMLAAWLLFRLRSRHLIPVARKAILDSLSDAVVVIDPRGKIIDVNPAARIVFRIMTTRPANHALKEYWPEMPSLAQLKQWPLSTSHEVSLVAYDETRYFDLRTSTIRDGARRTICHIIVLRDITDGKFVEQERDRLEAELHYARRLESLAMFAGGMAHEFNNAFTRMLGHTSLAVESAPPGAPVVEHLLAIERQVQRATELAEQILAYSGKGRFMVEKVCLGQLLRDSEHQLRGLVNHCASFRCETPDSMPAIEADPMQLRLMLNHLVANATESLNGYGNTVRIATGVTRGRYEDLRHATYCHPEARPGIYAYFEVSDTGCGMDEAVLGRIFDPFFSTKFTGRGLGMAAVLGIIRAHKGWIKIISRPGDGTTVHIAFPLAPQESPIPAPSPQILQPVS